MNADIKAAIQEVIQQSALINPQWIYLYEPTLPGGFPAISITSLNGEGVFADTRRNKRNYIFRIRCYQERQTIGTQQNLVPQEEAERVLTNLIDSLIAVFDNFPNYNLQNVVNNLVYVQPVPSEWGYASAPNVDIRIADIKLNAVVVQ